MFGIDLFAGAGGMSLGAALAGVQVRFAVENDLSAAETYSYNHPGTVLFNGDIRAVGNGMVRKLANLPRPLIVFGGPPCQGFSYSNLRTRRQDNPENWLFREFFRFVKIVRPEWVVFENVRGLTNTADGVFLQEVLDHFHTLKYSVNHGVLNAKDFGVPQDRGRLFIIGTNTGLLPDLPNPRRNKPPTVSDAISDLPSLSNGSTVTRLPYRGHATSTYARKMRGKLVQASNHLVSRNSTLVISRYQHIPQGGNWESIPARLMRNYKDRTRCHTGIYYRLKEDEPSIVIGNYRKNMLVHPTEDRGLSVREAARIQSFPDHYEFFGSIGFQQQQVGNAVPPMLAAAVFNSVKSQSTP